MVDGGCAEPARLGALTGLALALGLAHGVNLRQDAHVAAAMRGKRMVLDDRECRAEREILRWGKVLTLP